MACLDAAGAKDHLRLPGLPWAQSSHPAVDPGSPACTTPVQLTTPQQAQAQLNAAKAAVSMQIWPLRHHAPNQKMPAFTSSVHSTQSQQGQDGLKAANASASMHKVQSEQHVLSKALPGVTAAKQYVWSRLGHGGANAANAKDLAAMQNVQSERYNPGKALSDVAASQRCNWSRLGQGRADAANALASMRRLQPERGQGSLSSADAGKAFEQHLLLPQRSTLEQKMPAAASSQPQIQSEQGHVGDDMVNSSAIGESLQPCMSSQTVPAAELTPQQVGGDDIRMEGHAPEAVAPVPHLQRMKKRRVCASRLARCETPRRWWQLFTG